MPDYNNMPQNKDFGHLMDCIASDLFHGAAWHGAAANAMRNIGLRGFGRLHEYNAAHDFTKRLELEKILCDRLGLTPEIDVADIGHALAVTLGGPAELKPHLEAWLNSEREFAALLTEAVAMAAGVDLCVYEKLTCILAAVQEEVMRVKMLKKRLELGGYSGHDMGVISMMIHEQMENHPELGMDFNLG